MADPFAFAPSPVIGTEQVFGFWDGPAGSGSGFMPSDVFAPEYMAQGSELRALRLAAGRSLRDAAKEIGLGVVDLSSVERGRAHFVDFAAAKARLAELWTMKEARHG